MKLLTKAILKTLPVLDTQQSTDPIVYVKFFTPDSLWTWYVTEGSADGDDFLLHGYVSVFSTIELDIGVSGWRYFTLSELRSFHEQLGLRYPVRRDCKFTPQRI